MSEGNFALGRARGPIVMAYEQAKREFEAHEATDRPSDDRRMDQMLWHVKQARLAANVVAYKKCIDIIDKEIKR